MYNVSKFYLSNKTIIMQDFSQKFRRVTLIFDKTAQLNKLPLTNFTPEKMLLVSEFALEAGVDNLSTKEFLLVPVSQKITNEQVNQYLGRELELIIYDATRSFDVNAFTAVCGSIIGGGELVLLLPKRYEIFALNKTDVSAKEIEQNNLSPTLVRLVSELSVLPVTRWRNGVRQSDNFDCALANKKTSSNTTIFFKEQNRVIERILRCSLGHAKRPVVITANRGRGKSSAIGIAVATLVFEHKKSIMITSPRRENISVLLKHFDLTIQRLDGQSGNYNFYKKLVTFIPPDKLVATKPDCDLLIIEEAGAIPVQMLKVIAESYNRMVFSTTIDGYEGNGQGFELRFKSYLVNQFPQCRFENLEYPARWSTDDPLEKAINSAFLLSFEKDQITNFSEQMKSNTFLANEEIEYNLITKERIIVDNDLLSDIYQLLVTAHYQTRPSDLERILADKNLLIFSASLNGKVIATALVVKEGNLSTNECEQIEKGQLRIAGHLLPQALMAYQGQSMAGLLNYWRIMRIAVNPTLHRQTFGSQLITYIEKQAAINSVDIIGSSFSFTPDVGNFWYKQGFQCSRIALRKDSSTGNYPCEFLKLLESSNDLATSCYNQSINCFNQSFFYSIGSAYKEITTQLILLIIENQTSLFLDEKNKQKYNYREQEIKRYVEKVRSFEMIEWELSQFFMFQLKTKSNIERLSKLERMMLVAKSLQKYSWKEIVSQFELLGKNQAKEMIRNSILNLLKADT